MQEEIKSALRKAYNLGQTYWQQADSEYISQQRKSDETHAKFEQLVADTVAALTSPAKVGGNEREAFDRWCADKDYGSFTTRELLWPCWQARAALSADGGEESPSLTNPLTPYGMLVRALRIATATTLMDMARHHNTRPSLLSGMELGRKPVTIDDAIAASEFFSAHGVAGTLGALTVALQAAIADSQAKGE
ncbi:hypothetical protein PIN31009_05579 [Pandoraea iniqua]|uniref:hypothetical protein n=1 Tax=Pandoraea iniqua TaxID=2508288 RepID=UPI0012424C53|nr:hypothetical protein [Pandoraea iniqua]VVE59539.1 hypothetical protein PIN31009_05579 [Pandoraea iniqua]